MFLCTKNAEAIAVSAALISTVDSNHLQILIPIYIETGTSDKRRCMDIKNVISEIKEEVCLALPALRLFTGNCYTSGFLGMGKVKALEILIQSEHLIKTFKAIGDLFTLNAELFPLVEQFVCELYGLSKTSSTTKARYKKFCSKKKSCEPQQLPPKSYMKRYMKCYMKRVNYAYSPSYNLTPRISRVLIGQHLIFCSLTSPTCCNSPRKCTPLKYKRQKAGFPIVT